MTTVLGINSFSMKKLNMKTLKGNLPTSAYVVMVANFVTNIIVICFIISKYTSL